MFRAERIRLFVLGTTIAFAANFQIGFSSTYLNTPVQSFKDYLNVSLAEKHNVEMTVTVYDLIWNAVLNVWSIGYFVGIWIAPVLNDRYGRRGIKNTFIRLPANFSRIFACELCQSAGLISAICRDSMAFHRNLFHWSHRCRSLMCRLLSSTNSLSASN
jgi:MFS family permease